MKNSSIFCDVYSLTPKGSATGLYYIIMSDKPKWADENSLFCTTYFNSPANIAYVGEHTLPVLKDEQGSDVIEWRRWITKNGVASCTTDLKFLMEHDAKSYEDITNFLHEIVLLPTEKDKSPVAITQSHLSYIGGTTICEEDTCKIEAIRKIIKHALASQHLS